MARLSTTTTIAFFFFFATAAFFLAGATTAAEDRGPRNPAEYIIFSQGRKVAGGTTVSVPRNPAEYIIFGQGRKVAGGTTVSVPQKQPPSGGVNPGEYIFSRNDRRLTGGGQTSATQACDALEGNKKACYTITRLPGVTTPRALLDAALRVALGRARALKAKFDEAKAASKKGNPMASILGSCDKNYDDLVDALEEASRALQKGGSSYNLVTKMSAASTYATDCDNWYSERSLTSPYESVQRHAAQAVSVALGVAAKSKNL